jgi:hypothetical protein
VEDICPSSAKNFHIYIRMLHDACVALGGEQKLAQYLGVEVDRISAWLSGSGWPPDSVFLACVDVVRRTQRP